MAIGKISFSIGTIDFSSEGEEQWVAEQLDKILYKIPELIKVTPKLSQHESAESGPQTDIGRDSEIGKKTLPAFLKEKKATIKQVKKFLATAVWLEPKGKAMLTTLNVANALKKARLKSLINPSDCLNQNATKGFCEKVGNEFYVTQEGKASLEKK